MNIQKLRESHLFNPRWWLLLPFNLFLLVTVCPTAVAIGWFNMLMEVASGYADSFDCWFNDQFGWYDRLLVWMRKGLKVRVSSSSSSYRDIQ